MTSPVLEDHDRRPFAQSRMASRDISLASDSEPHDMKLTLGGLTSSEPDEDQVRLQLDVLLAESLAFIDRFALALLWTRHLWRRRTAFDECIGGQRTAKHAKC